MNSIARLRAILIALAIAINLVWMALLNPQFNETARGLSEWLFDLHDAVLRLTGAPGCLSGDELPLKGAQDALDTGWYTPAVTGGAPLVEDRCGVVWSVGGRALHGYAAGSPNPRRRIKLFESNDPALADIRLKTALLTDSGDLWAITTTGIPVRQHEGRWRRAGQNLGTRASSMAVYGRQLYLAAGVLYIWDQQATAWLSLQADLNAKTLYAAPWDRLYVAGTGGLFELDSPGDPPEQPLWRQDAKASSIRVITSTERDRLLLGSNDGVRTVDQNGRLISHELEGKRITALLSRPKGAIWAATADQGLWYRHASNFLNPGRWRPWGYAQGLHSDQIQDLYLDSRAWLWASSESLLTGKAARLESEIQTLPAPPRRTARHFRDACLAVKALAIPPTGSGAVGWGTLDGEVRVFFQGQQVCPDPLSQGNSKPLAVRAQSSALLVAPSSNPPTALECSPESCAEAEPPQLRRLWALRLIDEEGRSTALPPPDPLPPSGPHRMHIDNRGGIWVSSWNNALYHYTLEAATKAPLPRGRGVGVKGLNSLTHSNSSLPASTLSRHPPIGSWQPVDPDSRFGPHNPITAFADGPDETLWIGSAPKYNPETDRYSGANLHRFDGQHWTHWNPDDGLPDWHTAAISNSHLGLIVATNGGLARLGPEGFSSFGDETMTNVTHIANDDAAGLWLTLGDGGGLLHYDAKGFTRLTTRQGLFDTRLTHAVTDALERLWLRNIDGEISVIEKADLVPLLQN